MVCGSSYFLLSDDPGVRTSVPASVLLLQQSQSDCLWCNPAGRVGFTVQIILPRDDAGLQKSRENGKNDLN